MRVWIGEMKATRFLDWDKVFIPMHKQESALMRGWMKHSQDTDDAELGSEV